MTRRHLTGLTRMLPALGLVTLASDGSAEGVDRFAWPLSGAQNTGEGFDHDRANVCPTINDAKGNPVCDKSVDESTYIRDKDCGSDGAYDQHGGTDAFAPSDDTRIHAAARGVVISVIDEYGDGNWGSKDGDGFGNNVVIYHGGGLASLYAHMEVGSGLPVVGQWVECGDDIGGQGRSGNSTHPHLHFDVRAGVTPSANASLGGYFTGTRVDPYLGSTDDEGSQCGSSVSLWQGDGEPTTTCDPDDYVGAPCESQTLGSSVDDGACVQNDTCAWNRCVDGSWLALPEGAAGVACTADAHPHADCDAGVECSSLADEAECEAQLGACGWSCEQQACVPAAEVDDDEDCTSMPPTTCDDGEQDGDETGIDCGGSCPGCTGDPCETPNECASGVCEAGTCQPPAFDCHRFDGDPMSCGSATGCQYHECVEACAPLHETACALGCEEQCGVSGCVTGRLEYYSSNNCISGPATGVAEVYRYVGTDLVFEQLLGLDADGSFCFDFLVGEQYVLQQFDLPGFACMPDYYVHCWRDLVIGETGLDGVCAADGSCEDLGDLLFDCGS